MNKTTRPNFLIFMTDHQRGDMAPPFNRALTPNLDRVFKDGTRFTEAYCTSPHCCPSRASFFTGLYPSQHGVWSNVDVDNTLSRGLYDGVRTWSEDFKASGYNMIYHGKWHVSAEESPLDRGWDVYFDPWHKGYNKLPGHRPHPPNNERQLYTKENVSYECERSGESEVAKFGYFKYSMYGIDDDPKHDSEVVNEAIQAIRSRKPGDEPWCHYIGVIGPHEPYKVPERFIKMYSIDNISLPENYYDKMEDKPGIYRRIRRIYKDLTPEEVRQAIMHYLAYITYEDYLFGKIIDELESRNELENTVIIYTSDHGDCLGEHGLWVKGLPCFRPAYHVPLLVRLPAEMKSEIKSGGRNVDAFVTLADVAPTLLELAGIKTDRKFAGRSLGQFLKGETPENWPDAVYSQFNGDELYGIQRMVMTREWKYVYNGFDFDELYNRLEDPYEMKNRINDPSCKEVIREMCKRMWKFAYEHDDSIFNPYIATAIAPYGPGIMFL